MKRVLTISIIALMFALNLYAQTTTTDSAELTKLLKEFLNGAGRNDATTHDRFWADDLIYTGSSGRRIGKADIMRDLRPAPTPAPTPKPGDPVTVYTAEDIRIQQYGDTAIVAFRLVSTTEENKKVTVAKFLNSGTFLKRNGKWQVVNWQATKMPRTEEDAKTEASAAQAAFHQAMLAGDVKTLETLMDRSFIWTHNTGMQITRQKLLEYLSSGQLKYSKMETSNVTVSIYGETAIVRGVSLRQHTSIPGGGSDANPITVYYTLTFVNTGGAWKAVAMHTSRI
jgi:hypothetical protein